MLTQAGVHRVGNAESLYIAKEKAGITEPGSEALESRPVQVGETRLIGSERVRSRSIGTAVNRVTLKAQFGSELVSVIPFNPGETGVGGLGLRLIQTVRGAPEVLHAALAGTHVRRERAGADAQSGHRRKELMCGATAQAQFLLGIII